MKKSEITIKLEFVNNTNIELFEKHFLNTNSFRNCKAKTIRIRRIKNGFILDFYDIENKRQILMYQKLLLHLTACINCTTIMCENELSLLNRLNEIMRDKDGMRKKFYDLSKNYRKFISYE